MRLWLANGNRSLNSSEVQAGKAHLLSTPQQVNVDLTGICNIHPPCVFCSGKNIGHNYRPIDLRELDRYGPFLARAEVVNDDSFGEPLSHPDLITLARELTANGQRFNFVTNGLLLTADKAAALAALGPDLGFHVSFNAATPETFFKLTGKRFDLLVENVRTYVGLYRARNSGHHPDVNLTFIVMRMNRHEVPAFLRLAGELGVRALLSPLHDRPSRPLGYFGYDFVYEREMLPFDELKAVGVEAMRLAKSIGLALRVQWDPEADSAIQCFAEPGVNTPCLVPWRFLHFQHHSHKVYGCPYHKRPIGDVTDRSIEEIWNGDIARTMRESLARGDIPTFCWNNATACPVIFRARHERSDAVLTSDIVMGETDHYQIGDGWYALEEIPEQARWTSRRASFEIVAPRRTVLRIRCQSFKPHLDRDPARGHLDIEGAAVGNFRLAEPGWHDLEFPLPNAEPATGRQQNRTLTAAIVTDNPWIPAKALDSSVFEAIVGVPHAISGSRDTRELGIVVRRIWAE